MKFFHYILRLVAAMTRQERIALGVLFVLLILSGYMMLRLFFRENSVEIPKQGGTYIEGSVGEVRGFIPWFATGNDVDRDITSLIFSGLMRFDPETKSIMNDLATVTISNDQRTYTAELHPDLFWHDSTEESPHPVTADDVLFTFETIKKTGFQNPILTQNFQGVDLEKLDDRTVRFRLEKPYAFFTSNLTLGLVPKSALENVPVDMLDQVLDFAFQPVGAGPYSFVSMIQTDLSTEVTLKRFTRPSMPDYHIERVVFRVFSDYTTLLSDILNLNGIRQVPRNEDGDPILPRKFTPIPYTLPQYVALFFNLDRSIVRDSNVRLGLQLATNKQEIADRLHETHIVDTGLLEIDLSDWRYKFDAAAAQGAFFDSKWNVPEKVRLQQLLERREANGVGPLQNTPRIALLSTGASLTITGSTANLQFPIFVNGVRAETGVLIRSGKVRVLSGSWIVKIQAGSGMSGSIKQGANVIRMNNAEGDVVDSAFVERYLDARSFARASEEYRLVEQFLRSKTLGADDPTRIDITKLTLDGGFLRRRTESDTVDTRINERGEPLAITILTSTRPGIYKVIAETVKKQWERVGAKVTLDIPETKKEFEEKLLRREYDVVLFGQSLFDNLDSYPYWHSSQTQDQSGDASKLKLDAFNLSQYASFEADTLLVRIRETGSGESREKALGELNARLKTDIPAITLYSPLSVFAHDQKLRGVDVRGLALHADRFASLPEWYVDTERTFNEGRSWLSLPGWVIRKVTGN